MTYIHTVHTVSCMILCGRISYSIMHVYNDIRSMIYIHTSIQYHACVRWYTSFMYVWLTRMDMIQYRVRVYAYPHSIRCLYASITRTRLYTSFPSFFFISAAVYIHHLHLYHICTYIDVLCVCILLPTVFAVYVHQLQSYATTRSYIKSYIIIIIYLLSNLKTAAISMFETFSR